MNLPVEYAIKHFFSSTAFELIYSEAVANALDANATDISINIKLESYSEPTTLELTICDNGDGFTDENFDRFANLMKAKDRQHKGLGRLVYLNYFKSVKIKSVFLNGKRRSFTFEDIIKDDIVEDNMLGEENAKTELFFNDFKRTQLKSYDCVSPKAIKQYLKKLFMPLPVRR